MACCTWSARAATPPICRCTRPWRRTLSTIPGRDGWFSVANRREQTHRAQGAESRAQPGDGSRRHPRHPARCEAPVRHLRTQIDGDRATGESYTIAHHLFTQDGSRMMMVAWLRYLDDFVKIDGAWYFAARELILEWSETRELGTDTV
ncbi:nuclear transport factor 2 family protein [Jatrophihabitans sp. DSM 45814]